MSDVKPWRPIDTAPHDGTHIMGGHTDGWVGEVVWETEKPHEAWYVVGAHWTDQHDGQVQPTHWQPMPEPPKQEPAAK